MAARRTPRMLGRGPDGEAGVVAVWLALTLVVMLGFAAWAVDFSRWNDERAHMQKAADAAALAGAVYLPDDPSTAISTARNIAGKNGYPNGVTVNVLSNANQLKVTINKSVENSFAQVIGVGPANVSKHAVGEYESPQPLDMVLIIDRTGSMRTPVDSAGKTPLENVKDATRAVLGFLNPKNESIALGTLGPSFNNQTCAGVAGAYGKYSGNDDGTAPNTTWMISPFPFRAPANDYQNADGTLNASSQTVRTVNCLEYGNRTDIGDPVLAAANYLRTYGRPAARKGIIVMTDGAANFPGSTPCGAANAAANSAKAAGIQVLTIGFLSGSNQCSSDTSGTYRNVEVTRLLANMASPIKGVPAVDNGCVAAENTDGDNFFCQPKGGDIKSVFLAAVGQLAGRLPRIVE